MKKICFCWKLRCKCSLFILFAGFSVYMAGCVVNSEINQADSAGKPAITMMTWNIHNLFDGDDNGFEYDEFLESSGWSKEKYMGRINSISAAINTLKPLPDIISFQEIESLKILEDIAEAAQGNYSWSSFSSNPGAALGLGIISRFPITDSKSHSITINGDTAPRPVLELRIQAEEEDFIVFVCHWKSKLGGDDATENARRASVRVILRRIRELWKEEPHTGIIITGDLNESHDEFYRRESSVVCALLPDDLYCAQLTGSIGIDGEENAKAQNDFIVISKNAPPSPVNFPEDTIVLFSPWTSDLENGSYFYKDNWETIDHFLLSDQFFNNKGWNYEKAYIANSPPFSGANGTPLAYNRKTGTGLSDHLPLLITLKLAE